MKSSASQQDPGLTAGLIELVPAAVYTCAADGRITHYNERACRLWGRTPEAGQTDERFCGSYRMYRPDGRLLLHADTPMAEALRTGVPVHNAQVIIERPDGSRIVALVNISPLRDAQGGVIGAINCFHDVTALPDVEAGARAAATRLREAFGGAAVGIVVTAATGRLLEANPAFCRVVGYPPAEIDTLSLDMLLHGDDRSEVLRSLDRLARGPGGALEVECRLVRKDRTTVWTRLSVTPLRDEHGAPANIVLFVEDVGRRRRTEAESREWRERLGAALTASGTGTFRWDIRTNLVHCDENLALMLRLEADEAVRSLEDFVALFHPDDRNRVGDACHLCAHDGAAFAEEFRVILPDGDVRWLYGNAGTFADADGAPAYVTGACIDITDRRAAEEQVRRSEASFRELADAMPQIVWASGPDGRIDYFNRRWYESTGAATGVTGDEAWLAMLHPADRQRSVDLWYRSVRTGEPFEVEQRLGFPETGEYRWHLARALPVRDDRGIIERWYGTATDIHDQKRAEDELRRARTDAERANRAKMEFLAVVSHELRTPLNAIGGYAELLEIGVHGPLTDAQRETLVRIRRNKHHLRALIDDVLGYASLESGGLRYNVTDVSVRRVLEDADTIVQPQMQSKAMDYAWHCEPHVVARADRERLHQILVNLLSNAAKFPDAPGVVRVDCTGQDGVVTVRVRDDGPGIPADKHEEIFEPFVQLDPPLTRAEPGVGLGLSISRDLARGMGGDLTVESTPGKGATFVLKLLRA
jgi:PAS domain S-box-containing protein